MGGGKCWEEISSRIRDAVDMGMFHPRALTKKDLLVGCRGGGQQTARTCQLLQGQPEPQRHLAKLIPFPGQPASSDCGGGVHFRLTRDILGDNTCLQSSLLAWRRLCQPKQLIFPSFLNPLSPLHTVFASGQPNMRQGDGASGQGRGLRVWIRWSG